MRRTIVLCAIVGSIALFPPARVLAACTSDPTDGGEWNALEGAALDNLAVDSDGDTIFDSRELELGTDPLSADTEGDGFDDGVEDALGDFGFDPLLPTLDTDGDGLEDGFEFVHGTNPSAVDTDGDGYSDFDELLNESFGFDPVVASVDADFDGLEDGYEALIGSSPNSVDSDGDGVSDFEEESSGADPTQPAAPDIFGESVGTTYSGEMKQALVGMQEGGSFPSALAAELPYSAITKSLVLLSGIRPTAALMQRSVANTEADYQSYAEVLDRLKSVAQASSGARLFEWSERTIERNGKGRCIYALKISDNAGDNEPDKPEILFMGMHHARELVTVPIVMGLIDKLSGGLAGGDPLLQKKVEGIEFWFIPVVNPDGYNRAIDQKMGGNYKVEWRKNVHKVGNQTDAGTGVDLNRNYDFDHMSDKQDREDLPRWTQQRNGVKTDGTGDLDPNSIFYGGQSDFSEVETQAVRGLADNKFSSNEVDGLKCSISWHSYGGQVMHPITHDDPTGGTLKDNEKARLGALSALVADEIDYEDFMDRWKNEKYPVYGDSQDWLFRKRGVLALTIEAYSSDEKAQPAPRPPDFFPNRADKLEAVVKNNIRGGIAFADACLGPDFGDAEDPEYPSLLKSNGARHMDFAFEYLGDGVDGEPDAENPDQFDDGVRFFPVLFGFIWGVEITVTVLDKDYNDGTHRYDSSDKKKRLYINAWADWNGDGNWESPDEKIIGVGAQKFAVNPRVDPQFAGGNQAKYVKAFALFGGSADTLHFRFRLDYGEDVGEVHRVDEDLSQVRGWARFGEVEDYQVTLGGPSGPTGGTGPTDLGSPCQIIKTLRDLDASVPTVTFLGDLCANAIVVVGDENGSVQPLPVLSSGPGFVTVDITGYTAPANYLFWIGCPGRVNCRGKVAIGAIGATGATGAPGVPGATGAIGVRGPTGLTGNAGVN